MILFELCKKKKKKKTIFVRHNDDKTIKQRIRINFSIFELFSFPFHSFIFFYYYFFFLKRRLSQNTFL